MIEGSVSIREMAEKWNLTPRRIQVLCVTGRIPGAGKIGNMWAIPADAERPEDKRITTGEYKNWRKSKEKGSE